jgi:hypothetical protein
MNATKKEKTMQIEDIQLDAQDEFYVFDEENGNIFSDDDRLVFCEGFNRGQEAMRQKVLTMLGEIKDGV